MWLVGVYVVTSLPHCGLEDLCKSLSRNKTIQEPMLELIECNDYGDMHVSHMAKNQHLKRLEIAANTLADVQTKCCPEFSRRIQSDGFKRNHCNRQLPSQGSYP